MIEEYPWHAEMTDEIPGRRSKVVLFRNDVAVEMKEKVC